MHQFRAGSAATALSSPLEARSVILEPLCFPIPIPRLEHDRGRKYDSIIVIDPSSLQVGSAMEQQLFENCIEQATIVECHVVKHMPIEIRYESRIYKLIRLVVLQCKLPRCLTHVHI